MVNEKLKQLEETYNSTIIPELEKKITNLESDNQYLQEHAKKLQENLTRVFAENQNLQQVRCAISFSCEG